MFKQVHSITILATILAIVLAATLAGCGKSPRPSYYTLGTGPMLETASTAMDSRLRIGIRTVEIPEYLDQPAMMIRQTGNKLRSSTSHRWAGSLRNELTNYLGANLGPLAGTRHIFIEPFSNKPALDRVVRVRVLHFDGHDNGTVTLTAQWEVTTGNGETVSASLFNRSASDSSSVHSADPSPDLPSDATLYDQLARAHTTLAQQLCREIAQGL